MAHVKNVEEVIEDGLARVQRHVRVEAAYLFGSQVTGEANPDSDIDVAILSPDVDGRNLYERVKLRAKLMLQCESSLELHLFSSRAPAEARPSNFAGYIIAHGKRLV